MKKLGNKIMSIIGRILRRIGTKGWNEIQNEKTRKTMLYKSMILQFSCYISFAILIIIAIEIDNHWIADLCEQIWIIILVLYYLRIMTTHSLYRNCIWGMDKSILDFYIKNFHNIDITNSQWALVYLKAFRSISFYEIEIGERYLGRAKRKPKRFTEWDMYIEAKMLYYYVLFDVDGLLNLKDEIDTVKKKNERKLLERRKVSIDRFISILSAENEVKEQLLVDVEKETPHVRTYYNLCLIYCIEGNKEEFDKYRELVLENANEHFSYYIIKNNTYQSLRDLLLKQKTIKEE